MLLSSSILSRQPAADPSRAGAALRSSATGRLILGLALAATAALVGCSSVGTRQDTPAATPPRPAAAEALPPAAPLADGGEVRRTGKGRWVRSDWSALPGWNDDSTRQAWPALLRSCDRVLSLQVASAPRPGAATVSRTDPQAILDGSASPASLDTANPYVFASYWKPTCLAARALGANADEAQIRQLLTSRLQPWRIESSEGRPDGLMTGYFEPLLDASRSRTERHTIPLYAPPPEVNGRQPWYTRAQMDSLPEAQAALRGREIAWVADPLDALLLQIQGSGRLVIVPPAPPRSSVGNSADNRTQVIRVAYAAHNGQPYQSVGRWLVDQGAFTLEQASWPAIRQWARANPQRVREMINTNPRYVFFREEALPDPNIGALGAQGVALTPGRSIAVDRESIPYGTPVWLASTEPQPWSLNPPPARPLQRLVVAQDTGSAILGAVRADYFWGWGEGIEDRAGRTKQPLRLWVLWPR